MSREEVEDIRNWFLLAGAHKCSHQLADEDRDALIERGVCPAYEIYAFKKPFAAYQMERNVKLITVYENGSISLYHSAYLHGYMNERKAGVSAEDTTIRLYTNELHEQLNWWID